ncbi:MAG: hypothetical protein GX537_08205 [Actinobacteria bacterium]|nr:hypothetical protein [Actinomycetota bacterium]
MNHERSLLPALAALTGLAWMAAVLLIAANHKGIDLAGDLAYDRANRIHTLALVLLTATVIVVHRRIPATGLLGARAAMALVVAAVLMFVGNVVAFWGALLASRTSEQFWGGTVGWIIFLPGTIVLLGGSIGLARAARDWPGITRMQLWAIGLAGLFLTITTITWAGSPSLTLAPALLAAFALLATGAAVAQATRTRDRASLGAPARTTQPTG